MYTQDSLPPKIFISYSHDSSKHLDCVLELSDKLRKDGIDCSLDQYEESPPEGWVRWMQNQIRDAQWVLIICTETYKRRIEGEEELGRGHGVRWEGHLTYQELYNAGTLNTKFIPVLLELSEFRHIPKVLQSSTYYDVNTQEGYEDLYRRLTKQPLIQKPPLGKLRDLPHRERKQYFLSDTQNAEQPPHSGIDYNNQFDAFKKITDIIKNQKNKEIDVITISANNYDEFIIVDKIAPEHESVIKNELFYCAGGSGANTVCGLSRLGKKTAIVGCVNNDLEGITLLKSLNDFFVDTELLELITKVIQDNTAYSNYKTGSTKILVEEQSGRRQILVTPGINNCLSKLLKLNNEELLKVVAEKIKKSKILHLSSFAGSDEMEIQLNVLKSIRDENIIVSLTPGAIYVAGGLNELRRILSYTNIFFLYTQQLNILLKNSNEIEGFEEHLTLKDKVELLFEWRIKSEMKHPMIIVIKDYKLDTSNCVYKNNIFVATNYNKSVSYFGHQSERFSRQDNNTFIPEDTTGSGDALAAGFLYGILEREDIQMCTDYGFVMSREASHKLGARANLLDEISLKTVLTQGT